MSERPKNHPFRIIVSALENALETSYSDESGANKPGTDEACNKAIDPIDHRGRPTSRRGFLKGLFSLATALLAGCASSNQERQYTLFIPEEEAQSMIHPVDILNLNQVMQWSPQKIVEALKLVNDKYDLIQRRYELIQRGVEEQSLQEQEVFFHRHRDELDLINFNLLILLTAYLSKMSEHRSQARTITLPFDNNRDWLLGLIIDSEANLDLVNLTPDPNQPETNSPRDIVLTLASLWLQRSELELNDNPPKYEDAQASLRSAHLVAQTYLVAVFGNSFFQAFTNEQIVGQEIHNHHNPTLGWINAVRDRFSQLVQEKSLNESEQIKAQKAFNIWYDSITYLVTVKKFEQFESESPYSNYARENWNEFILDRLRDFQPTDPSNWRTQWLTHLHEAFRASLNNTNLLANNHPATNLVSHLTNDQRLYALMLEEARQIANRSTYDFETGQLLIQIGEEGSVDYLTIEDWINSLEYNRYQQQLLNSAAELRATDAVHWEVAIVRSGVEVPVYLNEISENSIETTLPPGTRVPLTDLSSYWQFIIQDNGTRYVRLRSNNETIYYIPLRDECFVYEHENSEAMHAINRHPVLALVIAIGNLAPSGELTALDQIEDYLLQGPSRLTRMGIVEHLELWGNILRNAVLNPAKMARGIFGVPSRAIERAKEIIMYETNPTAYFDPHDLVTMKSPTMELVESLSIQALIANIQILLTNPELLSPQPTPTPTQP
ncbi:MAG: hypothetical protein GF381_02415 [Candidatus Pacebacteria bacterium]|nr:hypothetical protein [Candidatus Paceibacterota bacterium]